jgi:hypothetical protein
VLGATAPTLTATAGAAAALFHCEVSDVDGSYAHLHISCAQDRTTQTRLTEGHLGRKHDLEPNLHRAKVD